jgi:hypothetical protein
MLFFSIRLPQRQAFAAQPTRSKLPRTEKNEDYFPETFIAKRSFSDVALS